MNALTKKIFLSMLASVAVAVAFSSCGKDPKPTPVPTPTPKEATMDIDATTIDFGTFTTEESVAKEFTVTTKDNTEAITLTLEGANKDAFRVEPAQLPKEGGKVKVTCSSAKEGDLLASVKVLAGTLSKEVALKAKVEVVGGITNPNASVKVLYLEEPVESVPFEVSYPSNYSGVESTAELILEGTGGAAGEAIKLRVAGADADSFELTEEEILDRNRNGKPTGDVSVTFTSKKDGKSEAVLIVSYAGNTYKIKLEGKTTLLPADQVIAPATPIDSKVKATFCGKPLANGSTIQVAAVMDNNNGYFPNIEFHFPAAYDAVVKYQKNFMSEVMWCIGDVCTKESGSKNPYNYGKTAVGEKGLEFHFPYGEINQPGYTNKATFTFTNGDDKFEFHIEFDIK